VVRIVSVLIGQCNRLRNRSIVEHVMVLQCPVGVSVLRTLTEMDVCSIDSIGIDRALG
jgi:hypothetical protein